jgi:hypothetical protein
LPYARPKLIGAPASGAPAEDAAPLSSTSSPYVTLARSAVMVICPSGAVVGPTSPFTIERRVGSWA